MFSSDNLTLTEAISEFAAPVASVANMDPDEWEYARVEVGSHAIENERSAIALGYLSPGKGRATVTTIRARSGALIEGARIVLSSELFTLHPDQLADDGPSDELVQRLSTVEPVPCADTVLIDGCAHGLEKLSVDEETIVYMVDSPYGIVLSGEWIPDLIVANQ